MRHKHVVIQMPRNPRLPTALGTEHRHEEELLRRRLHGRTCEDASRAEELEGLDLDGGGRAVEVLGEDDVGYADGAGGCDGDWGGDGGAGLAVVVSGAEVGLATVGEGRVDGGFVADAFLGRGDQQRGAEALESRAGIAVYDDRGQAKGSARDLFNQC